MSSSDEDQSFEVEKILDSRKRGRNMEFLVRWKGYSEDGDTWEPLKNIASATGAVNDFYRNLTPSTKTPMRRVKGRGAGDAVVSEKVETSTRKKDGALSTRTVTTVTKTETSSGRGTVSESSSPEVSPTVTRRSLRSRKTIEVTTSGDNTSPKRTMASRFAWLGAPCKACSWFKPTRQDIPIIILVTCLLVIASTFYIAKN